VKPGNRLLAAGLFGPLASVFRNPVLRRIGIGILLVLMAVVPQAFGQYPTVILTNALLYVVLALGLNVVVGYAGLLDLGYAAFFAVGAYTVGILTLQFGVNFWLTLPIAVGAAALAGIVRHDEDVAEAMGIDRVRVKLAAYVIGAIFGAMAGAFFAINLGAISPESFSFTQSVLILMAVILGGMGKIPGVILGAFVVILGPELLRDLGALRLLVFAVGLLLIMLLRPSGIWPGRGARR
jgi:ABC-type branched-subunit amino acid transport system permease subunit